MRLQECLYNSNWPYTLLVESISTQNNLFKLYRVVEKHVHKYLSHDYKIGLSFSLFEEIVFYFLLNEERSI